MTEPPLLLASRAQLEARLGGALTTEEDTARADAFLHDASALVCDETRRTDWTEDTVPAGVQRIVLAVAMRALRNPDGANSTTDTVGDRTRIRAWSDHGGGAIVYLTEEERDILHRYRHIGHTGLWTLSTERGDLGNTTEWINDQYGAEPFPIGRTDRL